MSDAAEAKDVSRPGNARSVRTVAIVIYGTFALLIMTIPQSLPNWLRDMEESPVQQLLLRATGGVQAAAQGVGLDIPYRRARAAFYAWAGKEDN